MEAAFSNNGTLEVQTGTVYLSGGFTNFSGTTLSGGTYLLSGTLKFTGASIATSNATVTLDGANSRILNQTDGDALANLSSITASGSFTVRNGRNFTSGVTLNNAGTLSAGNASSIGLNGGGTHTGNFNPLSGGNIVFAGGTHTVQTGVTFTGSGTTRVTTGVLNVTGNVSASSGSVFEVAATSNGRFTGSGTFTDNGTFNWTSGTIAGLAVVIASGAVMNISGGEDKSLRSGYTLTNNGTIRWSGAGNINSESGGGTINNSGTFEIQNDARLHHWDGTTVFNNAGTFRKSGGTGTTTVSREGGGGTGVFNFNNTGRVEVQTGTLNFWNMRFDNTGSVEARSGTLTLDTDVPQQSGSTLAGGSWNVLAGGTLNLNRGENIATNSANVTLSGADSSFPKFNSLTSNTGTFSLLDGRVFNTAGNLGNSGSLRLGTGSRAQVSGAFTQAGSGRLDLDIGGSSASGQFGRLNATGAASLGGTLNIALAGGFGPTAGDSYQVMTFASYSGNFTAINQPRVGGAAVLPGTIRGHWPDSEHPGLQL